MWKCQRARTTTRGCQNKIKNVQERFTFEVGHTGFIDSEIDDRDELEKMVGKKAKPYTESVERDPFKAWLSLFFVRFLTKKKKN